MFSSTTLKDMKLIKVMNRDLKQLEVDIGVRWLKQFFVSHLEF